MKIAIVNQHFHIGGVETFLLSLIRQFKRLGHDVHVFLLESDNANVLLPELLALDAVVFPFDALLNTHSSRSGFDVVLVTNTDTFFETLRQLTRGRFKASRLIAGTYQTRMYCLDRGPLNLHNRLIRKLFAQLPAANVIFGNDACRDEHARIAPSMLNSPIVPLIVDGDRFPRRARRDHNMPMRIVSIGRLDHFKTYNLSMLDVLLDLLNRGHAVSWDVYGSGMLHSLMRQRIAELSLGNQVRMLGDINYADIPHILNDAFAFVGSGLSMMEAAACGVPSLPAIEYESQPKTFGFPHEIPGISFFEPRLPLPRYDLGNKLEALISATPAEYESIGDAGREKMSLFFPETIARHYIQTFDAASTERPALSALPYYVFKASALLHRKGQIALKWLEQLRQ